LIYLYTTNAEEQYNFIESARSKGYDVLLMDGHLDTHLVGHLEQKFENSRFVRVDADIVDKIIKKEDDKGSSLSSDKQAALKSVLLGPLPGKENFDVDFVSLNETEPPLVITQSEFTRRMKDMSALAGGGMDIYGNLPDRFTLVVNDASKLITRVIEDVEKEQGDELKSYKDKIVKLETQKNKLDKAKEGKKEEEILQEEKDELNKLETKIKELENKKNKSLEKYGKENKIVCQLIDLALISSNMLKGENLTNFVKRSIALM